MPSGAAISAVGHGALLVSLMVGGLFRPAEPVAVAATAVSVISSAEFDAQFAPEIASQSDPATEPSATPPRRPVPQSLIREELALTPPPTAVPTPRQQPSETPAPPDAPRVAPVPVPEPDTAPDSAASPSPPITATPEPTIAPSEVEPPEPASPAPATTEIVTEAEEPGSGPPVVSVRPVARPTRPTAPIVEADTSDADAPEAETDEPEPPAPDASAIAGAITDALNGDGEPTSTASAPVGPPLTNGEKDGLRVAVQACWNTGALSTEALTVTVTIGFNMTRSGQPELGSIRLLQATGSNEIAARQAYETARRAIIRCGVDGYDLPAEKYDHWRDIEMTFNPERMRIK